MKKCANRACLIKEDQPFSNFRRNNRTSDGYVYICNTCKANKKKDYHWQKRKNPESKIIRRSWRLMRLYGVTIEEYEEIYNKQCGLCAICKKKKNSEMFVDHCHESGKVRELLCANCNFMLGHAKEDPDILISASLYLRKHK